MCKSAPTTKISIFAVLAGLLAVSVHAATTEPSPAPSGPTACQNPLLNRARKPVASDLFTSLSAVALASELPSGINAQAAGASQRRKIKKIKPPRDSNEIARQAEAAWRDGSTRAKAKHLTNVHGWLFQRFGVREDLIDRIMAAVKMIVLFPEMIKKPLSIDMFGLAGEGKTDIVIHLAQYLGLKTRFVQVNVKPGQVAVGLEIFRSLADVTLDGTMPPISLLFIDEAQKLKDNGELSTKARAIEVGFYETEKNGFVDEVAQRNAFERTLLDIYGNGKELALPVKSLKKYAIELRAYISLVKSSRTKVESALGKLADRKKIVAESAKPEDVLDYEMLNRETIAANEAERVKTNDAYKGMRGLIIKMKKDFDRVLGPIGNSTPDAVVEMIVDDPDAFMEFLEMKAEETDHYQAQNSYFQMLTLFSGNPENTIREFRESIRGMSLSEDQFREHFLAIPSEKVRVEMFDNKWGALAAGLAQRFNRNQMKLLPPLSSAEWTRFMENQFEEIQDLFANAMTQAELPNVRLIIDKSVFDLLRTEAINPTEGARVYFENATQMIGNFFANLAIMVVEDPENSPSQIEWSFDNSNGKRNFIASAWHNGTMSYYETAPVPSVQDDKRRTALDESERSRILAQNAGQIVMGMSIFGNLPFDCRIDLALNDASAGLKWRKPDKMRPATAVGYLKMALGSVVAQNLADDTFTDLGDPSLRFAHLMVRQLVDELRRREIANDFLIKRDASGNKVYEPSFPVPQNVSPEALEAMKAASDAMQALVTARASGSGEVSNLEKAESEACNTLLRLLMHDTRAILQANRELLSALVIKMESRLAGGATAAHDNSVVTPPKIDAADLLELLKENHENYKPKPTLLQVTLGWFGIAPTSPVTLLLTPQNVSRNQGTIPVPHSALFAPNPQIANARLWRRFKKRFFEVPYPQRQLEI